MGDMSLDFLLAFYEEESRRHPEIAKNLQILYPSNGFIVLNLNQQDNFRALREKEQEMQQVMAESGLGWWGLFVDGKYHSSYYSPTLLYGLGASEVRQGKTVLLAKYGCQEFVNPPKVVPHYN